MTHMTSSDTNANAGAGEAAARECAAIAADLERLKVLLGEAGDKLAASFGVIGAAQPRVGGSDGEKRQFGYAVTTAVTALQFQDMATQLTQHAQRRLDVLRQCVSRLSAGQADPMLATTRMQPVRQSGMGAGSIDLF
jgi:hypothetical protein